jgi:hypothetical protein
MNEIDLKKKHNLFVVKMKKNVMVGVSMKMERVQIFLRVFRNPFVHALHVAMMMPFVMDACAQYAKKQEKW